MAVCDALVLLLVGAAMHYLVTVFLQNTCTSSLGSGVETPEQLWPVFQHAAGAPRAAAPRAPALAHAAGTTAAIALTVSNACIPLRFGCLFLMPMRRSQLGSTGNLEMQPCPGERLRSHLPLDRVQRVHAHVDEDAALGDVGQRLEGRHRRCPRQRCHVVQRLRKWSLYLYLIHVIMM